MDPNLTYSSLSNVILVSGVFIAVSYSLVIGLIPLERNESKDVNWYEKSLPLTINFFHISGILNLGAILVAGCLITIVPLLPTPMEKKEFLRFTLFAWGLMVSGALPFTAGVISNLPRLHLGKFWIAPLLSAGLIVASLWIVIRYIEEPIKMITLLVIAIAGAVYFMTK